MVLWIGRIGAGVEDWRIAAAEEGAAVERSAGRRRLD